MKKTNVQVMTCGAASACENIGELHVTQIDKAVAAVKKVFTRK